MEQVGGRGASRCTEATETAWTAGALNRKNADGYLSNNRFSVHFDEGKSEDVTQQSEYSGHDNKPESQRQDNIKKYLLAA